MMYVFEAPGHVLAVVEVVLELGDGVLERVAVLIADLRPSGDFRDEPWRWR
jgi:hypothetical protein